MIAFIVQRRSEPVLVLEPAALGWWAVAS